MSGMSGNASASGPKIDMDSPYRLDAGVVRRFGEEGYARLRGVLSDETVRHFEPEITHKVIELNTLHLPMARRSTYHKTFLQVTNLWQRSDVAGDLAAWMPGARPGGVADTPLNAVLCQHD